MEAIILSAEGRGRPGCAKYGSKYACLPCLSELLPGGQLVSVSDTDADLRWALVAGAMQLTQAFRHALKEVQRGGRSLRLVGVVKAAELVMSDARCQEQVAEILGDEYEELLAAASRLASTFANADLLVRHRAARIYVTAFDTTAGPLRFVHVYADVDQRVEGSVTFDDLLEPYEPADVPSAYALVKFYAVPSDRPSLSRRALSRARAGGLMREVARAQLNAYPPSRKLLIGELVVYDAAAQAYGLPAGALLVRALRWLLRYYSMLYPRGLSAAVIPSSDPERGQDEYESWLAQAGFVVDRKKGVAVRLAAEEPEGAAGRGSPIYSA